MIRTLVILAALVIIAGGAWYYLGMPGYGPEMMTETATDAATAAAPAAPAAATPETTPTTQTPAPAAP